MPFFPFLEKGCLPAFYHHLRCCKSKHGKCVTEIALAAKGRGHRRIELMSVPVADAHSGQTVYRTALLDVTEVKELQRQVLEISEREQARIGQDLHDGLCQELTATAFVLKSKAKAMTREAPDCAKALQEAAETVNENAGRARDLARGMHPFELGPGGLLVALRELVTHTNERLRCRAQLPRSLRVVDESVALNVYRVAQEAVNNALKHARASEVIVGLREEDHELVLTVTDDGTGMRSARKEKRMGIHMMKYRANVCGGKLEIESRRGRGTTVTCRIPLGS
jgi:signal transduction histidine kinase